MPPKQPRLLSPIQDPGELGSMLVRGERVADSLFDQIYPVAVQYASALHWTPVRVVQKVVRLIAPSSKSRILDVGSGPGKFCSIAALTSRGNYTGVERKPALHRVAVESSVKLGASRATFILGDALDLDWSEFDVLYFFNPFEELIWHRVLKGPSVADQRIKAWEDHVRSARRKLCELPVGRRVVLFHGLGDAMPDCFRRVPNGRRYSGKLEVWRRVRSARRTPLPAAPAPWGTGEPVLRPQPSGREGSGG